MRCPKCKKQGAYIRKKTSDIVCRLCGGQTTLAEYYQQKEVEKKEEKKNT